MARTFESINLFVAFLMTREPYVVEARKVGSEKAAAMLAGEAKAMIGQEIEEWPALAASTVEEKERLGYTGRVSATDPLLRRGEFRNSISAKATAPAGVILGTDDPIAPWLEHGTSRMPPRPTITLTMHQQADEATHIIASHVMGAVADRHGPMRSLVHNPKPPSNH